MHPPLAQHKLQACEDLIEALKECHDGGFINKYFGKCNTIKRDLNMCLRGERIKRTAGNAEIARQKRSQIEKVWKEIEDES